MSHVTASSATKHGIGGKGNNFEVIWESTGEELRAVLKHLHRTLTQQLFPFHYATFCDFHFLKLTVLVNFTSSYLNLQFRAKEHFRKSNSMFL